MDDIFSGSGGLRQRRKIKNKGKTPISASLGVRRGYVAEPERPLPPGVTPKRSAKRIPTTMQLRVGDRWVSVPGDVSAGGALLLFGEKLAGPLVELTIALASRKQSWQVQAQLLSTERRGKRWAHHLRFLQPSRIDELDAEVQAALQTGKTRLDPR